ncbi:MAG: alpha-2-macroglobulin family protein [Bacteroidia bacterium]|nr:alpha-2-macroglobulin family protein [Bacteroidia bacterium]
MSPIHRPAMLTRCILLVWMAIPFSLMAQADFPYAKAWKQVDSLRYQQAQARTALEQVMRIRAVASQQQNANQYFRTIMYEMALTSIFEEHADSLLVTRLQAEINQAVFPQKNLLQSSLATFFEQYLTRNRWRISERTAVLTKPDDYRTWDLTTLTREITRLYRASLEQPEALQGKKLAEFREILTPEVISDEVLLHRPTLYDLLAHRALDFWMDDANYVTTPTEPFALTTDAMRPAAAFVTMSFERADPDARHWQAITLFQELLAFHLRTGNRDALTDIDLKRLTFVREQAVGTDGQRREALRQALTTLAADHPRHPAQAEVWFQLAQLYASRAAGFNPLTPNHPARDDYRQAIALCEKAQALYKDSPGAIRCENLQADIRQPSLSLQIENFNLPAQPMRTQVSWRNLKTTWIRVVVLDKALETKLQESWRSDNARQEVIAYILKQKSLATLEQALPDPGDHHTHTTELKLPALQPGRYLLIAADTKKFSADNHLVTYMSFQVSALAYFSTREGHNLALYLTQARTGAPVAGAKALLYPYYRDLPVRPLDENKTDANGKVQFQVPDNDTYYVRFSLGPDELHTGAQYVYHSSDPSETPHIQVALFTDRAIYRPGQRVQVKGIVMEGTPGKWRLVAAGQEIPVTLRDVNGEDVSTLYLITNGYGSIAGAFQLPQGGLTGAMTLVSGDATRVIQVEEYKRPTFEVTFDTVAAAFRLNDRITLSGKAGAYSGAAIDAATVTYRVEREARYPYLPWYMWRWFQPSESQEIANGTAQTDADGRFQVTFPLTPDPQDDPATRPVYTYRITADVTDIAGETRTGTTSVEAGYQSLAVSLEVPESVSPDGSGQVSITVRNLQGAPVSTAGRIKVTALRTPDRPWRPRQWEQPDLHLLSEAAYHKAFPYDLYAQENEPETWPETRTLADQIIKLSGGEAAFAMDFLRQVPPGMYRISLAVPDGQDSLRLTRLVRVTGTGAQPVPPVWLSVQADKSSYQPCESASVQVHTYVPGARVWYRLSLNDQLLDSRWLDPTPSQTLTIPIVEAYRGNVFAEFVTFAENQSLTQSLTLEVPYPTRNLSFRWNTFRSPLLPGQQEQWKLTISGPDAEAAAAEMVATLYDASLDAFVPHGYSLDLALPQHYPGLILYPHSISSTGSQMLTSVNRPYRQVPSRVYPELNLFGAISGRTSYRSAGWSWDFGTDGAVVATVAAAAAPAPGMEGATNMLLSRKKETSEQDQIALRTETQESVPVPPTPPAEAAPRRDLRETAFFFPQVETNDAGEITFAFTMPEALTRWRFIGLAHTRDLVTGVFTGETVTQKDLMIVPALPRFLREGDQITLTARVINLSEVSQTGTASLRLLEVDTDLSLDQQYHHTPEGKLFTVEPGRSTLVSWRITVPPGTEPVRIQMFAATSQATDGQENILPVLPNRMLVTETLPLTIRGTKKVQTFRFDKLLNAGKSSTLTHHQLTAEITANPLWHVVQALPYLMEYPYDCTEQLFSRYYSHALATHLANANPGIRQVFDQWVQTPDSTSLMSQLEKNPELKSALLTETPWVMDARDQAARKRRIGLLFDQAHMARELKAVHDQLALRQLEDGSFSWFPGMSPSPYITTLVATGMGDLIRLGAMPDPITNNNMLTRAVDYLDLNFAKSWREVRNTTAAEYLGTSHVQYLYMRSLYPELPVPDTTREAYDHYLRLATQRWANMSPYMQGMLALVFHRGGDHALADVLLKSLVERAVISPVTGMYWKGGGYYWYEAPIEQQALLIQAFEEIMGKTEPGIGYVEDMKAWLMQQKRTQDWRTTRATVAACNALLSTGESTLYTTPAVTVELGPTASVVSTDATLGPEAGTGYVRKTWTETAVQPDMGTIKVRRSGKGLAWTNIYWQYFEQLDKITPAQTPLSVSRSLFLEQLSPNGPVLKPITGPADLKPGDKLIVRLEIKSQENMEYVHLKDMRASGVEPVHVISEYHYQDGLGYYESTRDAATHFFFDYLPKGVWVLEYPVRVSHAGDFSNGITTLQCMYAPEYSSHAEGIRVQVSPR